MHIPINLPCKVRGWNETIQVTPKYTPKFWELSIERVLSVNSEQLILQMADRLAEDGYRDAGYKYVSIDVSSVLGFQKLLFLA